MASHKKPKAVVKRDEHGKYAKGSMPASVGGTPGIAGLALEIKRRILLSWDVVEGDKILERVAEEDPVAYLRLIMALLVDRRTDVAVVMYREIGKTEAASGFLESCRKAAAAGPLTHELIIEQLAKGNGRNGRQRADRSRMLPGAGGKE